MNLRFGLPRSVGFVVVLMLLVGLWTCRAPGPLPTPRAALPMQPALPRSVRVLLTALDRQERFEVTSSEGPQSFWRQGPLVVRSTGQSGPRLRFAPVGAIGIGTRSYLGALEVQCHPQGGLAVFLEVDLERYVEGVVAAELPLWSALPAELQAQAIAVRTYTAYTLEQHPEPNPYLFDGVQDQAFHGQFVPGPNEGAQRAAVRLARAVEATRGLVLMQAGHFYDVRYHAACGGITADRSTIFPGTRPSPRVPCEPCAKRAQAELAQSAERRPLAWEATFAPETLHRLAREQKIGTRLTRLEPIGKDPAGRWQTVRITGDQGAVELPLDALRKTLGYAVWKSGRVLALDPVLGAPDASGLKVRGLGRGHGVGLCQEGTHDYAAMGLTDFAILEHYFPGSTITRLSGIPKP